MPLIPLLAALSIYAAPAPVSLARKFNANEKLAYSVKASLHVEQRQKGLDTWIPEDLDLSYGFTTEVKELKADGIAVVRYLRPTFTEVQGETFDAPPKTKVDKVNQTLLLTVSPINEILEVKDQTPKKKKTGDDDGRLMLRSRSSAKQVGADVVGQFISEIYRLALQVGSFDSAMDFAPRMSFDEVSVGDTWKKTVGYQPQKLKGKEGKQAVQRLDYTYTYKGLGDLNGKKVQRVDADLKLTTDLGDFVNQAYDLKPEDTGLKSIPLNVTVHIEFALDVNTKRTISAHADTSGGFSILVTAFPDDPIIEQKIKGQTMLQLVGVSTVPAKKGK